MSDLLQHAMSDTQAYCVASVAFRTVIQPRLYLKEEAAPESLAHVPPQAVLSYVAEAMVKANVEEAVLMAPWKPGAFAKQRMSAMHFTPDAINVCAARLHRDGLLGDWEHVSTSALSDPTT
jgi:hypothetical protein